MKYVRSLLETFKKRCKGWVQYEGSDKNINKNIAGERKLYLFAKVYETCKVLTCKNSITKGEVHTGNDKW